MTRPTVAVVSMSGGKDSTATALLALDQHGHENCRFVFADTGHEHEATVEYATVYLPQALGITVDVVRADFTAAIARKRRYVAEIWPTKGVPPEVVERALSVLHPTGIPFLDLCLWKGRFPSRMAQFCTQELKRYPLDGYTMDLLASGARVENWQGVRRDESANRRDAADREMTPEGWEIVRPIAAWSAAQVFDLLRERGIRPNPLYLQGCARVGCFPCVNTSKGELSIIARRYPEHIDRVREWERLVGMASKRGYSSLLHHADGEGGDAEHAYRHSNIDAMADWARTSRGGKQYDLLQVGEAPSCSSVYGLCE